MKCPRCGYFNVPGATVCGKCKASLENETKTPSYADIYPPRKRNRTLQDSLAERTAKISGRFSAARGLASPSSSRDDALRAFCIALMAVIPGLGHFALKRRRAGGLLFLMGIVFFAAAVGIKSQPVLLNLLIATIVLSVALCSFELEFRSEYRSELPRAAHVFRAVMLTILALAVGVLAIISGARSANWSLFGVTEDASSAQLIFSPGDQIVVDKNASAKSVTPGQIVSYELPLSQSAPPGNLTDDDVIRQGPDYFTVFGSVIAKGGDLIEVRNGRLFVNGKKIDSNVAAKYPVNAAVSIQPQTIPKGAVATIPAYLPVVSWAGRGGIETCKTDPNTPYYSTKDITGRVVAVLAPNAHRRLF